MSHKRTGNDLVLVKLNNEQITLAKQVSGRRRKITHALLCGAYGQMFGTEKRCRKYYFAWKYIFRRLFDNVYETEMHPIECYESTFNLVVLLGEEDGRMEPSTTFSAPNGMELFVETAALHYQWAHAKTIDDGPARVRFNGLAARFRDLAAQAPENPFLYRERMLAFAEFLENDLPRISVRPSANSNAHSS